MNGPNEIEIFRKIPENGLGDTLQTTKIMEELLFKIRNILKTKNNYPMEVEKLGRDLYTRAFIMDTVFNPSHKKQHDDYFLEIDPQDMNADLQNMLQESPLNIDSSDSTSSNDEKKEENELYYHTPAIGIFHKGVPIFLSHNYVQALGAENTDILKRDIIAGVALNKYYTFDSAQNAKNAVLRLHTGRGYKDLVLETKTGKILSWNSFGNKDGIEIRIGNDITFGQFQEKEGDHKNTIEKVNNSQKNIIHPLSLKTIQIVQEYGQRVNQIVTIQETDKHILRAFCILSEMLEKIWMDGQYLMNISLNDYGTRNDFFTEMVYNPNYAKAIGLSIEELDRKIKKGTLLREHYNENTQILIQGLVKILQEEQYYIEDFSIKNALGEYITYSWFRILIQNETLGVNRTFGIGTRAISELNRQLYQLMGEK